MRCVLQRVREARVEVDAEVVGSVGRGWLALVGVERGDADRDADWLVDRVAGLRAFSDDQGKMNLAAAEVGGGVLVVSQFTLLANLSKGRRPGFDQAEGPDGARALCQRVENGLRSRGLPVEKGVFGADMKVHLVNDGPVTFVLDSRTR